MFNLRFYILWSIALFTTCIAQGQQFAGISATNSSTQTIHNEDDFREFKDEDYSHTLFQQKWLTKKLLGYSKSQWLVNVLADGDFSRALTDKSVTPRTGQIGFNAVKVATMWQLKSPPDFKTEAELKNFFDAYKKSSIAYDKRRGEMSWQTFDEIVKKWKVRKQIDDDAKAQVNDQISQISHNLEDLKKGINVYNMPAYKAVEAPRREQLRSVFQTAQQARDIYRQRYLKFLTPLRDEFNDSENDFLKNRLNLDSSAWVNGTRYKFLNHDQLAKLQREVSGDNTNTITLTREQASAKQHRADQLALLQTKFNFLSLAFGDNYLDSLAQAWPKVRARYLTLDQKVKTASDDASSGTVFTNVEYGELVRRFQLDATEQIRIRQDTLAHIEERLKRLNAGISDGELPFEKIRYRNRIELNLVVSLGNGADSLRARGRAATPTVIANRAVFGSNLLLPGSVVQSGQSVSMNILVNPFTPLRNQHATFGFHGFFNYSSTRWSLPAIITGGSAADTTYQIGVFSLSAGLQYTVFDISATLDAAGHREGNNVKFAFQTDFVYRNIGGELGRPQHSQARETFLGTRRRDYLGFQPGVVISVDNFRLTAGYAIFPKEIPGFSSGRLVLGVGFTGDLQAGRTKLSGAKPWRRLFM